MNEPLNCQRCCILNVLQPISDKNPRKTKKWHSRRYCCRRWCCCGCCNLFRRLLCGHHSHNHIDIQKCTANEIKTDIYNHTRICTRLAHHKLRVQGIAPKIIIIASVNRLKNDFTLPFSLLYIRDAYTHKRRYSRSVLVGSSVRWTWLSKTRSVPNLFTPIFFFLSKSEVHFLAVFHAAQHFSFHIIYFCWSENLFIFPRLLAFCAPWMCVCVCFLFSLGMLFRLRCALIILCYHLYNAPAIYSHIVWILAFQNIVKMYIFISLKISAGLIFRTLNLLLNGCWKAQDISFTYGYVSF